MNYKKQLHACKKEWNKFVHRLKKRMEPMCYMGKCTAQTSHTSNGMCIGAKCDCQIDITDLIMAMVGLAVSLFLSCRFMIKKLKK